MSGQIFQANFTQPNASSMADSYWLQGIWSAPALSNCIRPAEGSRLPIVCGAQKASYSAVNSTQYYGLDEPDSYRLYSSCCPANWKKNQTGVWTMTNGKSCPYIACFTDDENLAKNFDRCIQDRSKESLEQLIANGTVPANATVKSGGDGRCEYIDFKELKKGVKDPSKTSKGNDIAARHGVLIFTVAMLTIFVSAI